MLLGCIGQLRAQDAVSIVGYEYWVDANFDARVKVDTTSTPGAPWFQRPWLLMQSFSFLVSCTCFKLLFRAIHRLLEIRCKLTNNNDIKQVYGSLSAKITPPPINFS